MTPVVRLLSLIGPSGLFLCSLLIVTVQVQAATPPSKTLLVFGDSLSAAYGIDSRKGWVYLLQEKMAAQYPRWQVVNASLSGETTAGGLARLPAALKTHGPDLVLLELGANDGLRGLPLELMAKNLTAMVQQIQQQGARVLLFDMRIPPNYGPIYSQRFNATFANLAKSHGLVLVPFLLDGIAGVAGLNQADGIHPNAQAQPQVLMTIWPHLEPQLRRVSID